MIYGICPLSVVPVQADASSKSEQRSQLLFGEVFTVLKPSPDDMWWHIESKHDAYQGWVERQRVLEIDRAAFNNDNIVYSADLMDYAIDTQSRKRTLLPACSVFHYYDNGNFFLGDRKFEYHGAVTSGKNEPSREHIEPFLEYYMHTPYLWGGRHPLGIDCSGLVQNIMRLCGFLLPRDSLQQSDIGTTVSSIQDIQYGDLAFFSNSDEYINHVGIVTRDNQLVHAAECVKFSRLDHQGLFDLERQAYTHQLRIIKRLGA